MTTPVLTYVRVSTLDQDLARQVDSVLTGATQDLNVAVDADDYHDVAGVVDANVGSDDPIDLGDVAIYADKSTGTNTERGGYQAMMDRATSDPDVEAIIVHEVTRISRSAQDLMETADRLEDADVDLYVRAENLEIKPTDSDPYQEALFQLLGVFAELEAKMTRKRIQEGIAARMEGEEDYHHGRPPIGFDIEDGKLYQNETFSDVVAVLDMVQSDQLSKRKAARRLDTSRSTISRALERPDLYGL